MPKLFRFMSLSKNALLILSFALILGSCRDRAEEVQEKVLMMKSVPIHLPLDEMSCWINDSILTNRPREESPIKLVVYIDSPTCTECTMNSLYSWYDYTNLEKKNKDILSIYFIISSEQEERVIASYFRYTGLNHPIYIDKDNIFKTSNPSVPEEEVYHTFLLNQDDSVILVGNPLKNTQIKNLYEETLEQIIDKYQKGQET